MAQLAIWIGLCLALALLLRRRVLTLVLIVLVLWAAVPGVASPLITGQARAGALAFHPATWLIVLAVAVQVVVDFHAVVHEIARRFGTYLCLSLFLAVAFLATETSRTGSGLVLFLSQMVGPVLLFLLIGLALDRNPGGILRLRNGVLAIAAVQAALALVEWVQGGVLLYRQFYETNYWFDEVAFPRWMGTLDHPLTLSLLLAAAIPLLAGLRSVWLQIPLVLVMAGGMLTTQSRVGLVAAALGVAYVVLVSRVGPGAKIISMVAVAAAAGYAATSTLSSGVADRLANDSGSAGARTAALEFFGQHGSDYLFTGGGIGSSYRVAELGGLTTSFESSILIYAVDVGVVFSLLYFGIQVLIVMRGTVRRTPVPGLVFAGVVVVVIPQTYNALGAQSFAGPLLWTVLGMLSALGSHRIAIADAVRAGRPRRPAETVSTVETPTTVGTIGTVGPVRTAGDGRTVPAAG